MIKTFKKYYSIFNFSFVTNRWLKSGLLLLRAYILVGIILYLIQGGILFQPGPNQWDNCSPNIETFKKVDITYKGETLRGWIFKQGSPKKRILMFHGNGGHACNRYFWTDLFKEQSIEMVFIEYPGYDGTPLNYKKLLERGLLFHDYFRGHSDLPTYALGESIGTGPATYLAAKRELAGLILYSPYTAIADVVPGPLKIFPKSILLKYPFPAEVWAESVDESTFVFHGDRDVTIPIAIGERQANNFENGAFYKIKGAGHNNWFRFINDEFLLEFNQFVSKHVK